MRVQVAERLNHVKEYYFSSKMREIRAMVKNGKDIINLGIGNPDLGPADGVIKEIVSVASTDSVHGYQPYRSIPELREAFSRWYKERFSVNLNPDSEILPLMGSKEGIMHISLAFLNRGDGVLIPDPGYPAYEAAAKMTGARSLYYNLKEANSWLPDLKEIESQDLNGVKLMWVNFPNMPTGARPDSGTFRELIEFGRSNNILIINDNPYGLILNPKPESILSVKGSLDTALELNSLSKSHNMAGWRVGMIAGSERNIESVLKVKSNMDSGMFLPVQRAAVQALMLPDKWYTDLNQRYQQRRAMVYKILDALGSEYSTEQSGLFIWSQLPEGWKSSYEFSDSLTEKLGIFITPGSIFGSNGRGYIRTSLCVDEPRLEECLERVKNINLK